MLGETVRKLMTVEIDKTEGVQLHMVEDVVYEMFVVHDLELRPPRWAYQKRPKSRIKENVLLKAGSETCLHLNRLNGLDISVHKQNSTSDCKTVPKNV